VSGSAAEFRNEKVRQLLLPDLIFSFFENEFRLG